MVKVWVVPPVVSVTVVVRVGVVIVDETLSPAVRLPEVVITAPILVDDMMKMVGCIWGMSPGYSYILSDMCSGIC